MKQGGSFLTKAVWMAVASVLLGMGLVALAALLFSPARLEGGMARWLPVPLRSSLRADYTPDEGVLAIPAMQMSLVEDVIHDQAGKTVEPVIGQGKTWADELQKPIQTITPPVATTMPQPTLPLAALTASVSPTREIPRSTQETKATLLSSDTPTTTPTLGVQTATIPVYPPPRTSTPAGFTPTNGSTATRLPATSTPHLLTSTPTATPRSYP